MTKGIPRTHEQMQAVRALGSEAKAAAREKLTRKQEAFCREYMKDRNVLHAALRAGFTDRSARTYAYKVYKLPIVQARIAELEAKLTEDNAVTIDKVISTMVRLAEKAEEDGRYGPAIRAAELLGKYLGMFIERQENSIRINPITADSKALDAQIASLLGLKPKKEDPDDGEGSASNPA